MTSLSQMPIFEGLPPDALHRLEFGATVLEPRSGTEIFSEGEPADAVFAVIGGEGRVHIGVIGRRGKKLMVEVFRTGDIFGEIGVIDGEPRTASATAEGRVRLMRIAGSTFLTVLNNTAMLGQCLAQTLSRRLRRTFELFRDATFETLDVRLARQLIYLGAYHGRATAEGIVLVGRFKQADLADLLGTTPRSIITILNAWRRTGLVRYDAERAQLTICNETLLRGLAERDVP